MTSSVGMLVFGQSQKRSFIFVLIMKRSQYKSVFGSSADSVLKFGLAEIRQAFLMPVTFYYYCSYYYYYYNPQNIFKKIK